MQAKIVQSFPAFNCFIKRRTTDGLGPFFSDSSKDRRLQSVGPSSISSCENAVRLTVSVPVCSTGATSPFPCYSEINRVSVVARGEYTMLHKPPCRQIEKAGEDVRCLSSSGVYKKTGKGEMSGRQEFTILIVLTYQRCMLTAGIFPLTVFCKNGDITNPRAVWR